MLSGKTPVTVLQELLQKKNQIPTYNLIYNGVGTHEPIFKYEVSIETPTGRLTAIGTGKSKKEAKHNAAQNMLDQLISNQPIPLSEDSKIQSPYADLMKENAVGSLQDFCAEKGLMNPEYTLTRDEGLSHAKIFGYKVVVSSLSYEAESRTKKQAKHLAASGLLEQLKDLTKDLPIVYEQTHIQKKELLDDEVMKMVQELNKTRKERIYPREQLGLLISEQHNLFKDPSIPISATLNEKIKGVCEDEIRNIENPKEILEKILDEMNISYTCCDVPVNNPSEHAVISSFEMSPRWSFFGNGKTRKEAEVAAVLQALVFLSSMLL